MATFQDRILGGIFENAPNVYDANAGNAWGNPYWNPGTEDPYTDQGVRSRIYNTAIERMGWQDLLRGGFQRPPEDNYGAWMYGTGGGQGYNLYDTIAARINASGWDDAKKKASVLKAIENHYGQYGSGFTEWSTPEGIAGLLGLPDYKPTVQNTENLAFSQQHEKAAREADADSFSNALTIGGGLLGAWMGPGGGWGDLFGGGAGGLEELASLTGSGGSGGAGVGGFGGFGGAEAAWGVNPQGGSMDWWSEYGLTPADVGMEAGGWTTNPSFSDLMGGAVNMGGAVPPYTPGSGIMDWLRTNKDAVGLLGKGGATLLGLLGSREKADALKQLYERSQANRQPFLGQATQWLNDPASFMNGPGKSAMDANLRALSARYGNPIDSPTALSLANDAALRNWLGAVTGLGGVGLGGEATQAALGSQAANAQGGAYDALGYGLNAITNPQMSLTDILKMIQGGGFQLGKTETV